MAFEVLENGDVFVGVKPEKVEEPKEDKAEEKPKKAKK
jgi:hypothetical protein